MNELIRAALLVALSGTAQPQAGVLTDALPAAAPAGQAVTAYALPAPVLERVAPAAADAVQLQPVPVADAWLGSDKFRHVWMSYATTAFAFAAARAAGQDADAALWVAVPVAAAAGVGKEIYDRSTGGIFSVRDLVADALGVAAGYFLLREVR